MRTFGCFAAIARLRSPTVLTSPEQSIESGNAFVRPDGRPAGETVTETIVEWVKKVWGGRGGRSKSDALFVDHSVIAWLTRK